MRAQLNPADTLHCGRAVQATIMTDPETADQTYIGPMTPELVEQIIAKVSTAIHVMHPVASARHGCCGMESIATMHDAR